MLNSKAFKELNKSEQDKNELWGTFKGYWISPLGKLINLKGVYHAGDVCLDPIKFNITYKQLRSIHKYRAYKDDQKELSRIDDLDILILAIKQNFIKVRHYSNCWFISSPHNLQNTTKLLIKSNILPIIYESKTNLNLKINVLNSNLYDNIYNYSNPNLKLTYHQISDLV